MPDLHPIVKRLDELIRETIDGLQYAVKWKRAYYGLPELGWVIEIVRYDVSVQVDRAGGPRLGLEMSPVDRPDGGFRHTRGRPVLDCVESRAMRVVSAHSTPANRRVCRYPPSAGDSGVAQRAYRWVAMPARRPYCLNQLAPVAQWTEQQPSKLTVAGSNPAGGAAAVSCSQRESVHSSRRSLTPSLRIAR